MAAADRRVRRIRDPALSARVALLLGAALLAAAALAPRPAAAESRFVYPLRHPPRVSSTFGTYRLGHHHAGLDLTTDGDETVPVIAAADGEIVRIRRNDRGYGRAIYVAHAGGWLTVYAHLSAFAPKLHDVVRSNEEKRGSFAFTTWQRPPIPVKRGEVIGWVGTSGTDLVHLHFEVRHKGAPVNPLTNGLPLPDTRPPAIRRLLAVPRSPDAHVEGRLDERMYRFTADGALTEPVVLGGDVRLMVEAVDFIDGLSRAVTPYAVALYIDGRLWHESVYEAVSYADKGHTELDFHPRLRAEGEGMFHTLIGGPGPRVRAHRTVGRSLERLEPGRHAARIVARDAAGHRTEATFTLEVARSTPCATRRQSIGGPREATPAEGPLLRDRLLAIPVPELCDGPYDVRVDGERTKAAVPTRLGESPALALTVPGDEPAVVEVGVRTADGPVWRRVETIAGAGTDPIVQGPIHLTIGRDARFWDYPTLFLGTHPHDGAPGLEPVTPLFRLANGWVPTRGGSTLGVAVDGPLPPQSALYFHERGRYWWMGRSRRDRFIRGWTVHFGEYAVLRDTEPPQVGAPRIEPHPAGFRLVVPVQDEGSGVRRASMALDGEPVFFEHQRGFNRLVYLPLGGLPPGERRLTVAIEDRVGQTAQLDRPIVWPAPAVPPVSPPAPALQAPGP